MPLPNGRHGYLEARLGATLYAAVTTHGLGRVYVGETGFDLTLPDEPGATVLGVDVAFLLHQSLTVFAAHLVAYIFRGAPLL